jgi:ApaG protein
MDDELIKKIAISIETEYVPSHSSDEDNKYFFAYAVTIKNQLAINIQLLSRHWKIVNSNGAEKSIEGIGVVGEQPIIYSGEDYTYTSATEIDTPVGHMYGIYSMETEYGERFDAEIPKFHLIMPRNLH